MCRIFAELRNDYLRKVESLLSEDQETAIVLFKYRNVNLSEGGEDAEFIYFYCIAIDSILYYVAY